MPAPPMVAQVESKVIVKPLEAMVPLGQRAR